MRAASALQFLHDHRLKICRVSDPILGGEGQKSSQILPSGGPLVFVSPQK
jgi:hypothetical protein